MHSKLRTALIFALIICIGAGISFRLSNLDFKAYSYDEAITSLRISGYSWRDAVSNLQAHPLMSVGQLIEKYQAVNAHNGVTRTVIGLGQEEAQLTPLYFVLVRYWAQLMGHSVAAVRGFSVALSLALLVALHRFASKLFDDKLTTLMVVAIAAVSPFLVLYAQDARPYMLLCLTAVLSANALWRACRVSVSAGAVINPSTNKAPLPREQRTERQWVKQWTAWVLYSLSAIVGLYSHLLFVLVIIGHGLYVMGLSFRQRSPWLRWQFGSSLGVICIAFLPWAWMMQRYHSAVSDRVGDEVLTWKVLPETVFSLIRISARIVLDAHWSGGILRVTEMGLWNTVMQGLAAAFILALISYACYCLCQQTPFEVWGLVLLPMGVTVLALLAKGALTERYLMVYFLGINVAIAYCLADKLHERHVGHPGHYKWWLSVTSFVLIAGLLSNAISSKTPLWSIKYPSSTMENPAIAAVVNRAASPCVLVYQPLEQRAFGKAGEDRFGRMLALSHLLKPSVMVGFLSEPQPATLPAGFSDYFIYRPTAKVRSALSQPQGSQIYPVAGISEKELMVIDSAGFSPADKS